MIKVGEEGGTLEDVLGILNQQMEREHELRSKIIGAMIYPAIIVFALILIGVVMSIIVIPKLARTFKELNIDLPFTTKIVIGFGNFLAEFWYLLPVAVIFLCFLVRMVLKTETGKKVFDTIVFKIPIVAGIVKKANSARTIRTLSSLIGAGVPLVRSLTVTADTLGNVYYKKALKEAAEEVKKGAKLSEILAWYQDLYSSLVIQMIKIGEETGETAEILVYKETIKKRTRERIFFG